MSFYDDRQLSLSGIYTLAGNFSGRGEYPTTEIKIFLREEAPSELFEELTSDKVKGIFLMQHEGIYVEYHSQTEACLASLTFAEYLAKND